MKYSSLLATLALFAPTFTFTMEKEASINDVVILRNPLLGHIIACAHENQNKKLGYLKYSIPSESKQWKSMKFDREQQTIITTQFYTKIASILELSVTSDHHQLDVDTLLLEEFIKLSQEQQCTSVAVSSSHEVSSFYKKNQFKKISNIKDAIYMVRQLDSCDGA